VSEPVSFHTLGLVAKPEDPRLSDTLAALVDYLRGRRIEILVDANAAAALANGWQTHELIEIGRRADLVLVVGGDGTLLNTARTLDRSDVPLVGINLGRLGFLVDISPQRMLDSLAEILAGNYIEDRRFLLEARIGDGAPSLALNDVVLHKWNIARMIEFETHIDSRFVDVQRSDGIIVSTPTGSTAYALSGGGPLLAPGLDAIALVPICPHTLSNRPIVVHGGSEIRIRVCGRTDPEHVRVTCDGQTDLIVGAGEELVVRKHPRPVRLFHPQEHDHFELLRAKLGWGDPPK
jgi:NAD+ kinase